MKKLLLLLAGLLFAVLPSKAQTTYAVSQVGIMTPEELTEGDYIIYAIANNKTPGYVTNNDTYESGSGPVLIKSLDLGTTRRVSDQNYIWTVTKNQEGKFSISLKSDEKKFWRVDICWNKNMQSSEEKAWLVGESNTRNSDKGISFRLSEIIPKAQNQSTDKYPYIYCNGLQPDESNVYRLSYWGEKENSILFIFYKVKETDNTYPFNLSDQPINDKFAENTYWYYMTVREKYVTHDEELDYCPASAINPVNYGSFWAFVKTESGAIEIYNAATGPKKVLASDAPEVDGNSGGDETKPTMIDKNELGTKTGAWSIKVGDDNTFYLKREGQTEDYYLNERSGTLAFWSNSDSKDDPGSQFRVQEVDINEAIGTVREQQSAVSGAVGTLDSESYADFTAALDKGTIDGLIEALKIRELTGTTIQFEPSKYYYIYNGKDAQTGYITINKENKLITENNKSGISKLFKFEETGEENIYNLKVQGVYIEKAAENSYDVQLGITSNESDKGEFQLIEAETGAGVFRIKNTNSSAGTAPYIWKNYSNVAGWNGTGNGSQWYLIEAPSITTEITPAGYATVNYPFAVQLPENESISAYIGTVIQNDNSKLLLKKISNGLIPANTPVVLEGVKGETRTYTLTIVTDNASTNPEENVLKGTLLPEAISETFVLGMNNDNVGFYKLSNTDNTVGANKAYLPKSALPTLQAGVKGVTFSFDDNSGETTGIEDATINLAEEEFYDLQGRRVMNPTKGIYVTKSGKKVLFTK